VLVAGCASETRPDAGGAGTPEPADSPSPSPSPSPTPAPPDVILARSTVPVLCYHQIREYRAGDGAVARSMIHPPDVLERNFAALADAGYTPVTGHELVDALELGTELPSKPVLLTFDDGSVTHLTEALPALQRRDWPATFFPMTVVLGNDTWLTRDQVRELHSAGMTIGAHSWDHPRIDRLEGDEYVTQLDEPAAELADILGEPVDLLAYPHGAWNAEVLPRVKSAGYRAAFQLLDSDQDPNDPLLAIRRLMPVPGWDDETLIARIESEF
jgi:peptidoglycan/xylan/chitin deacetylase (PgdA/CDA1 family)